MKKFLLAASAAVLPFALPGVAYAQDDAAAAPRTHAYIGVQAGLHDLGVDTDEFDTDDFEIDDSAMIYGVYGGVDFDIGTSAIIGVEGNFNKGSGPIDTEYGVAGRLGFRTSGGTIVFARAGYQWVNVDAAGLLNLDDDDLDDDDLDIDDTIGDYTVGVGADIAVGESLGFRVAVDTISFDTLRPSVGLHLRF
ncbi:MAG TPA: outer membrane beta-barrel protein [Allosphingosinicella sp.]|jgi:opacity protein-like surface antigen